VAETLLDVRHEPKARAYELVQAAFDQVMGDTDDAVTAMATMSALLHHGFGFLWTGFYRVVAPDLLRVGPYQGTLGCLDIRFGRGVCGTAAAERRAMIVPDVNEFPGHIACDARSRSEIVVPAFGAGGELVAVLDVDSERANTFDTEDQAGLERLVTWFAHAQARRG